MLQPLFAARRLLPAAANCLLSSSSSSSPAAAAATPPPPAATAATAAAATTTATRTITTITSASRLLLCPSPPSPSAAAAAAAAAAATAAATAATAAAGQQQQKRGYIHFSRTLPEDYDLPIDTLPKEINKLIKKKKEKKINKINNFLYNYWYWRIKGEITLLNPSLLHNITYQQLAADMGLQVVTMDNEHMVGILELYEYLKTAPFVGPFGTTDNPVLVPSVHTERIVGCTGGTGENEHYPLWFRCREGFLYRCGECDQIFMHVRVLYSLPEGKDPFPADPDVQDVFSIEGLKSAQKLWNSGEYLLWPTGHELYCQLFLEGALGNPIPEQLVEDLKALE